MKITVCGAGPGGLGVAACLLASGYDVSLYEMPEFASRLLPFSEDPRISSRGHLEFSGTLSGAHSAVEDALKEADVVFIVTHAAAHRKLAGLFAGVITEKHLLVLCPGYVGGGLEVVAALREFAPSVKPPRFVEASSLPLISRKEGERNVHIAGRKRGFFLYTPPDLDSHPLVKAFPDIFAPMRITRSPLEPGLNEINIIVHAVVTLLNASRIDKNASWRFYRDGLTPAIVRIVELIDRERVELEKALGLSPHPLSELLTDFYADQGMKNDDLYSQLSTFPPFESVPGPLSFETRFITEDIPFGLVPMFFLGKDLGLEMPYTSLTVSLAEGLTGGNFFQEGRRIASHGYSRDNDQNSGYLC